MSHRKRTELEIVLHQTNVLFFFNKFNQLICIAMADIVRTVHNSLFSIYCAADFLLLIKLFFVVLGLKPRA